MAHDAGHIAVSVNGRTTAGRDAVVPVFDHGFLYGEGIYETLRTYHGRPFLLDRHLRRLRTSAGMIALPVPFTDEECLRILTGTMHAAGLGHDGREAYLRLLLTRGVGELSYDPAACGPPTVVVIAKPHVDPPPEAFAEGVRVAMVGVVRNHPETVNPLIKSNNLLNCALAMQEAYTRGAFEGVMRNYRGELAECTTANLFLVRNGVVTTPPLTSGLLAGITREFVFELCAAEGIRSVERVVFDPDLFEADEAFLTSTTREIVPITTVDHRVIGSGRPGPTTLALLRAFRARADALSRQAEA